MTKLGTVQKWESIFVEDPEILIGNTITYSALNDRGGRGFTSLNALASDFVERI